MDRYDNGEPILKDRIEDEDWYPDYQGLMELAMFESNLNTLYENFLTEYQEIHNKEQALRWSVTAYNRGLV